MAECRVYWGSHGCSLPRGHTGGHVCSCAFDDEFPCFDLLTREEIDLPGVLNVGMAPYYGPGTHFYGEDALDADDDQVNKLIEVWGQMGLTIPYPFLPLQDCVDLSTFLVEMTSAVQGWMIGLRGVGGAVDVATITRTDGLQAIKRKRIEVKETPS